MIPQLSLINVSANIDLNIDGFGRLNSIKEIWVAFLRLSTSDQQYKKKQLYQEEKSHWRL